MHKIIALDDIRFLSNCSEKEDRFCDFESEDICGYQTVASSEIVWSSSCKAIDSLWPVDR